MALLSQRQCSTQHAFRRVVAGLQFEEQAERTHQPRGRGRDPLVPSGQRHRFRVLGQRVQARPGPHILWVAHEGGIHPAQRLFQHNAGSVRVQAAARDVQHQAIDGKPRQEGIARHQGIGGQVGQRLPQVLLIFVRDRNVQQEFRHRIGGQERQAFQ